VSTDLDREDRDRYGGLVSWKYLGTPDGTLGNGGLRDASARHWTTVSFLQFEDVRTLCFHKEGEF
jgi:hypothetical protein